MDAPLCKLCHTKHYGINHVWGEKKGAFRPPDPPADPEATIPGGERVPAPEIPQKPTEQPEKKLTPAERQKKWRLENLEKAKQKDREAKRKKREAAKTASQT